MVKMITSCHIISILVSDEDVACQQALMTSFIYCCSSVAAFEDV